MELFVVGAGYCYPDARIENELLSQLGGPEEPKRSANWIFENTGISSRCTTLPLEYLIATRNSGTEHAIDAAEMTPTDLAVQATKLAFERAEITAGELGLILGAGSTPLETTPSEAQRVGKEFGLKLIPAYDLFCSSCDFTLQLKTLMSWKEAEIPDYVLLLSTNTPTQRVDYRSGPERMYFGDGAAAIVVSPRKPSRFRVKQTKLNVAPRRCEELTFDTYTHARMSPEFISSWIAPETDKMLAEAIGENSLDTSSIVFIDSQFDGISGGVAAEKHGLAASQWWNVAGKTGCSLGSGPMAVFAQHWHEMERDQKIVMVSAGAGLSSGYTLIEVSE